MTNEELKLNVGSSIARLRRERGMTQAELAERINYSDKAVSKWERGESLPDVLTLLNLAQQLGTDLNTLTSTSSESAPAQLPAEPEKAAQQPSEPPKQKRPRRYMADRVVIQKLCSILVWVVALFLHMILDAFRVKNLWLLFVAAIPANAIVLLSLRSAWRQYGWNRILISVILWGALLTLYLLLLVIGKVNVWRILLIGLLGQAAIILWFRMFRPVKEDKDE